MEFQRNLKQFDGYNDILMKSFILRANMNVAEYLFVLNLSKQTKKLINHNYIITSYLIRMDIFPALLNVKKIVAFHVNDHC